MIHRHLIACEQEELIVLAGGRTAEALGVELSLADVSEEPIPGCGIAFKRDPADVLLAGGPARTQGEELCGVGGAGTQALPDDVSKEEQACRAIGRLEAREGKDLKDAGGVAELCQQLWVRGLATMLLGADVFGEETLRGGEPAHAVGEASCGGGGWGAVSGGAGGFEEELKGIGTIAGLLEEATEIEVEAGVVICVASGDKELGAGASVVVMLEEVARQLQTDLAAPGDAVSFPGAIDGRAEEVDCLLPISLLCREACELEVDETASGFRVPKAGEVVEGLIGVAGRGKRFCEQKLIAVLAGGVGECGAKGVDGLLGLAGEERGLSAAGPAPAQVRAVCGKGAEQKERDGEEGERDQDEAEEGEGIPEDEASAGMCGRSRPVLLGRRCRCDDCRLHSSSLKARLAGLRSQ